MATQKMLLKLLTFFFAEYSDNWDAYPVDVRITICEDLIMLSNSICFHDCRIKYFINFIQVRGKKKEKGLC